VKLKLTPRSVQGAKPFERPYEIRDTELKGLLLRVQPSGVKSYVMEFRRGERRTIGNALVLTVEQARTTARKWASDRDEGKLPPAARGPHRSITLGEFIEKHYAPWVEAERKAGSATISNLKAQFGFLYRKPLGAVTAWQLDKFKASRLKAGIAPATVNRDLDRIRAVLSKAVEWGRLETHPLAAVKRVKGADNGRVRFLTAAEERRLRDALAKREADARLHRVSGNAWAEARGHAPRPMWPAKGYTDHLAPLVLLALNTGMRRGELFGLRWDDVDTCNKVLTVRAATAKGQRTRHIQLNAEALAVLKRWKDQGTGDGLVFPGRGGAPLTNINKAWAALCTSAKLDNFRFHDCRHHFASKLAMAGIDLYTIKELLGHADFAMTQRYAHLAAEHKANAVAVLDFKRRRKASGASR
jgi:integrase